VKTDLEPGMMKPKAKALPLLKHSFYKIKEVASIVRRLPSLGERPSGD
jgi:hypothetical protein